MNKNIFKSKDLGIDADILEKIFMSALTRVTTEFAMLNDTDVSADILKEEVVSSAPFLRYLDITTDHLNNEFVKKGVFVPFDPQRANEVFLQSLTGVWLRASSDEEKEKNELFRKYKNFFFESYFSKLMTVTPSEAGRNAVQNIGDPHMYANVSEFDLLRSVIGKDVEQGDSVLFLLFPLYGDPKIHYKIEPEIFHTHLQRLIERQGDDLVLINADTESGEFLLAFMESLPFSIEKHKEELLARLATLLMNEGKRI